LAEWKLSLIRDRPAEASSVSPSLIERESALTLQRIETKLPKIPTFNRIVQSEIAVASTGTPASFSFMDDIRLVGTIDTKNFVQRKTEEYQQIQKEQNRRGEVRHLVEEVAPKALSRFDSAAESIDQFAAFTLQSTAAATAMRNLIDSIKGEIWDKARGRATGKFKWERMAERLFQKGPSLNEMLSQGDIRSKLTDDLTDVLKERAGARVHSIEQLWMRVLDHLFVVLSLIKAH
jgi:hypothetical protein